jgi:diguanylate cyclase
MMWRASLSSIDGTGWARAVTGAESRLTEIRDLAARALDRLSGLGVPPTPENFQLWFSHLGGDHPDLSRAMDAALTDGRAVDEDCCADLYERYLATDAEAQAVVDTGRRMQRLLECLQDEIATVGRETAGYNVTLGRAQGRSRDVSLTVLLQDLLNETLRMQHRALQLQDQLCAGSTTCAELRRELRAAQQMALTDRLTGVANRRCFDKAARTAVARARDGALGVSLLLADVDHLARFNVRHGPALGDDALRLVATSLERSVGEGDVVARLTGGRFGLILPGRGSAEARAVAERARHEMSARELQMRRTGARIGRLTLSIGVVELRRGEGLRSWIDRAALALGEAKRAGRDRVVTLAEAEPVS